MDEEIRKILEDHENRIKKLELFAQSIQSKPEVVKKKISIKEFILSKNLKDDVQKTLAIGYYFEKYEGLPSFNVKDLDKGFRDAREKVPSNVADKIQKNIAKGHVMEAEEEKDGLKAYVLTNSGEKFVENDFKLKKVGESNE
jgi:hypothetical protein